MIDLIKGLILGIIMWFLMFLANTAMLLVIDDASAGVSMLFLVPFVIAPLSWYYLKNEEVTQKTSEGLRLGLFWILLSIVLDVLIMAFLSGRGFSYFLRFTLWLGYVEILVLSTTIGYITMKTKRRWLRE